MNWRKGKIGDVCIVGDGAHASIERQCSGIMYLTSKNFKNDGLDLAKVEYIKEEDFLKYFRKDSKALTKPRENDIVLSIIGSIGTPYVVKQEDVFGLSSSVAIIRTNEEELYPQYLYYWILTSYFQSSVHRFKSGVAQSFLSLDMIRSLPLHYPTLEAQQKIASVLSAYDDLIENNLRRIKLLEESAQLLFKKWFVDLHFPGHELTKVVDGVPEGWELKSIEDILDYNIGGGWGKDDYEADSPVPAFVIRGADIPRICKGEIAGVPYRFHSESNFRSRELKQGDIVFEVSGGSKGQPVGRALLVTDKLLALFPEPVICASFCKLLRPVQEDVPSEYLYLFLMEIRQNGILSTYENQSASNIINFRFTEFISRERILKPAKKMLNEFINTIKPLFNQIYVLGTQNQKLKQARDILLPRLMDGGIEV